MPNTFLAHAYDLGDPWTSHDCPTPDPLYDCQQEWYMGAGIHPRLKYPVGQRLAVGAMAIAYGARGHYGVPTIAGCAVDPSGGEDDGVTTLTVRFNETRMRGAKLAVNVDLEDATLSSMHVEYATGNGATSWAAVNISLSAADPLAVRLNLLPLGGATPLAVRYAWGDADAPEGGSDVLCCAEKLEDGVECSPAACPIMAVDKAAVYGGLPANPFLAKIEGGKCVCPLPQRCDA